MVATHGGVIRTVICRAKGLSISQIQSISTPKNASDTILNYADQSFRLKEEGIYHYLKELQTLPLQGLHV